MEKSEVTTIEIAETSRERKGKAPLLGAAAAVEHERAAGYKRGVAIFDLILRISAATAALAATIAMGTTEQTLPFFTQFFQFQASYDDLPTFTHVNSYWLPCSLRALLHCLHCSTCCCWTSAPAHSLRHSKLPRNKNIYILTVTLATSAAASSAAIVYLAHNGNSGANWLAICQQFNDFCQRISGAVVAAFVVVVLLIFLVVLSALALRKH
ncbi:hypothetical protein Pfo_004101 [Paulownia fortunei]|nr:hypothetical protein Pfo_004101 [Paulownia fortunei]